MLEYLHPALSSAPIACSNLNEGITICDPSQKDCPVVYCNDAFLRCGRRAAMDC